MIDVSRADAPAKTIGEHIIENPGQVPVAFEIEYNPDDIDDRFTYAVQGRITENGELRFISDTRHAVITRGSPTQVDMVLKMVAAATPQPAVTSTAKVTGSVTYRERIALRPDAVVEVRLIDVSRANAPAMTIAKQIIENPGQVPVAFEIEYNPDEIDDRFTYAIQVKINEEGKLRFINNTRYAVITRGSPTHVDMVLKMVPAE